MESGKEKVIQTLSDPDTILEGDFGALIACRLYSKTPVTHDKYLCVVYKELSKNEGFMLTAYFASNLSKRRKVLWNR